MGKVLAFLYKRKAAAIRHPVRSRGCFCQILPKQNRICLYFAFSPGRLAIIRQICYNKYIQNAREMPDGFCDGFCLVCLG